MSKWYDIFWKLFIVLLSILFAVMLFLPDKNTPPPVITCITLSGNHTPGQWVDCNRPFASQVQYCTSCNIILQGR
jgi:hypothetical protein